MSVRDYLDYVLEMGRPTVNVGTLPWAQGLNCVEMSGTLPWAEVLD